MTTNQTFSSPFSPSEARRGDGLLVVAQNNESKTLTIQHMNDVVEKLLGYEEEKAAGRWFEVILSSKMAEMLDEEIEYRDDAPDLGDVLQRQRELKLRHRMGQEVTVNCTVSRLMSEGKNACFQLVIPNEREKRAHRQVRDFIALNLEGRQQLEETTSLPNRETALHFLPLLKNYLAESQIEAAVAVLRMDRHAKSLERYGYLECVKLLQHTAACCRNSFRSEDIIFTLSDHTLGIVLIDISREAARLVLNRLRWNIRAHRLDFGGKPDFSVTVSVSFNMLGGDAPGDTLFLSCEGAVADYDLDERNALIEMNG